MIATGASGRHLGQAPRGEGPHATARIALIDECLLRRMSALLILRAHLHAEAHAFGDATEYLQRTTADTDGDNCVLFSVGGRSLTDVRQAAQANAITRACTSLIVLSDIDHRDEVVTAFRLGAKGFVPTSLEPQLVIRAIRMVMAGGTFVPASVLIGSRASAPGVPASTGGEPCEAGELWTDEEAKVMRLLVLGKGNKEIAQTLGMDERTVKLHVRHVMRRLGANNRTQAALHVHRSGTIGKTDDGKMH